MSLVLVESTAELSACRRYRYELARTFAEGPAVAFIGLNPSTADEHADDPTIRRCVGFARRWGYGRLLMLNLYALRSTDPHGLFTADVDARGEREQLPGGYWRDRNLSAIAAAGHEADLVVCAWGATPGPDPHRIRLVLDQLHIVRARTRALALTRDGHPRHPLYMAAATDPIPYPTTEVP